MIYLLGGKLEFPPTHTKQRGANYNDGDKEEEYILSSLLASSDVSSTSSELESYIRDWPSKYHLSRKRSLAYRSLSIHSDMKVLEIGSGCGAVTRYLGETGAEVVALEGSPRRARITKERTRGLKNVTVLASPFEPVDFTVLFDLIICNGVLEYAPLFINSNNPFADFLTKCSEILSPTGATIVAIENQYGLRYFSSGKEEHTNVMYDGLHGYSAKPGSARTFPRQILRDLLEKTIGTTDILLPIPDYKLPRALIRETLANHVNIGELIADLQSYDFGSVVKPKLHERLAYHEMGRSNLIKEMANSFFMISGPGTRTLCPENWQGSIYKNSGLSNVIRKVDIYLDTKSCVRVTSCHAKTLSSQTAPELLCSEQLDEPWIQGISVHTLVSKVFCHKKYAALQAELAEPLQAWWRSLSFENKTNGCFISPNNLDAIWRNAKQEKGIVTLFDQEWVGQTPCTAAWIIYRAVSQFYNVEFFYFHNWNRIYRWYPPFALMIVVGRIVGIKFSIKDLWTAIANEAQFQNKSLGKKLNRIKMLVFSLSPLYFKEFKWTLQKLFTTSEKRYKHIIHLIASHTNKKVGFKQ
jgi:SAM-dependent methyltransferase